MTWKFWNKKSKNKNTSPEPSEATFAGPKFKILVADFYDNISNCGANNLANALQGGPQGLNLRAVVSGEQIVLVANRSLKRRGKGELVTWK